MIIIYRGSFSTMSCFKQAMELHPQYSIEYFIDKENVKISCHSKYYVQLCMMIKPWEIKEVVRISDKFENV